MSLETTIPDVSDAQKTQETPPTRLFKNRNFGLLAIGQAISIIGDFVYSTTLLVWVFVLTHSAAAVSGVLVAQYVPIFLLGPVAGVFVDRWNRRTTMIATTLLQMGVALLPLLIPGEARLAAIYASVFLLSGISRFFTPARAGVLQVVVAPQQQAQAASIGQVTFAIAIIVGPAIASPLYFVVGPVVAILINAVSFLVSALFLLAIRVSRKDLRPYVQPEKGGASAVVSELYAGLRLIATTRVLLMVIILALIAMLGAGALNALDIIFVSQRLHVSVSLYGPLSAVAGLGTLVGAVLAGVLASRIKPRVMLAGCVLLLGMGIVVYSFQSWFLAALIINFFAMIPQGGIDVGVAPLLMNSTPHEMMGRVQSFLEMTMYGVSLLSVALAGYFGQFIPVYVIFAICGGLIALAGVFGWFAIPS